MSATLQEIAEALDAAIRHGSDRDEPEGARFITMSDTLALSLGRALRRHAGKAAALLAVAKAVNQDHSADDCAPDGTCPTCDAMLALDAQFPGWREWGS
jgi:hypothetical protein